MITKDQAVEGLAHLAAAAVIAEREGLSLDVIPGAGKAHDKLAEFGRWAETQGADVDAELNAATTEILQGIAMTHLELFVDAVNEGVIQ